MNYVEMMPQRNKQLKIHQVVHNANDLQQSTKAVLHLLGGESYDKPCDIAPGRVGCICRAAAVCCEGIKGLPKASKGSQRLRKVIKGGIAHVGVIQEQPIMHCFSTNAQHQQQHEVRDEAAG